MEKQGYFSGKEDLDDTDLSMGLIHQKTSVINTLGMLKADDDPDDLPALLLHEQAYDLQTSRTWPKNIISGASPFEERIYLWKKQVTL